MADLLDHLLVHLAAQGIVRAPSDAAGKPLPPLWRSPADGAPAPGEKTGAEEDDGVTVSAFLTSRIPPLACEESRRQDVVDLHIRAGASPAAGDVDNAIYAELQGTGPGGRHDWAMVGGNLPNGNAIPPLYMVETRLWRGYGLLYSTSGQGYTYTVSYRFEYLV